MPWTPRILLKKNELKGNNKFVTKVEEILGWLN